MLQVTTKRNSYIAEPLLRYILSIVDIDMLMCSSTSSNIVTIPKDRYKLMLQRHQFLLSKKMKYNFFYGSDVTSY
jgi:hypothetical protein